MLGEAKIQMSRFRKKTHQGYRKYELERRPLEAKNVNMQKISNCHEGLCVYCVCLGINHKGLSVYCVCLGIYHKGLSVYCVCFGQQYSITVIAVRTYTIKRINSTKILQYTIRKYDNSYINAKSGSKEVSIYLVEHRIIDKSRYGTHRIGSLCLTLSGCVIYSA